MVFEVLQGHHRDRDIGSRIGPLADGRASPRDFFAGRASGGLRNLGVDQAACRGSFAIRHTIDALGNGAGLRKTGKKGKRGKKPGAKNGHRGSRRPPPERIDWEIDHRADCCPNCGGRLKRGEETRTRYTEDIPDIQPEVTEHTTTILRNGRFAQQFFYAKTATATAVNMAPIAKPF